MTKRSITIDSHRGQMSFPGGRIETDDRDIYEAASREMQEEVNAKRDLITFLGYLKPVQALDGRAVICTIAYTEQRYEEFAANEAEVAALYAVPWKELRRENCKHFRFNIFGVWRESPVFEVSADVRIWGLTAKFLHLADLA